MTKFDALQHAIRRTCDRGVPLFWYPGCGMRRITPVCVFLTAVEAYRADRDMAEREAARVLRDPESKLNVEEVDGIVTWTEEWGAP